MRARRFGSLSPLSEHIQAVISASAQASPGSVLQSQDFTKFTVSIKREDGGESSIRVLTSSYSQGGNSRYVQVSFEEKGEEEEVDARAMALQIMFGGIGLPMASTAVVVAEDEDEFTPSERAQLLDTLISHLPQHHPDTPSFLFSPSLKLKDDSYATSAISVLKSVLGGSLAEKRFGITHFSSSKSELARLIANEKGKVVWLSEARGACARQEGVDIEGFLTHFKTHGTVKGFDGGNTVASVALLGREDRDVAILGDAAGLCLLRTSQLVAETDFLCIPPSFESRFSGSLIPGTLFNIGEPICAFLTHILASKSLPTGWVPPPPLSEPLEKLLKSKAKVEKKQKEAFLTAVRTISDYTIAEMLNICKSDNVSLRCASIRKGLQSLAVGIPKKTA